MGWAFGLLGQMCKICTFLHKNRSRVDRALIQLVVVMPLNMLWCGRVPVCIEKMVEFAVSLCPSVFVSVCCFIQCVYACKLMVHIL